MRAYRKGSPASASSPAERHIDETTLMGFAEWKSKLSERKCVLVTALRLQDGTTYELADRTGIDRSDVASVLSILRRRHGLVRASGVLGKSAKRRTCNVWTLGQEPWFKSQPRRKKGEAEARRWRRECQHLEEVGDVLRTALLEALDVLAFATQGANRRRQVRMRVDKTKWLREAMTAYDMRL